MAGAGTQTTALAFGGRISASPDLSASTEEFTTSANVTKTISTD